MNCFWNVQENRLEALTSCWLFGMVKVSAVKSSVQQNKKRTHGLLSLLWSSRLYRPQTYKSSPTAFIQKNSSQEKNTGRETGLIRCIGSHSTLHNKVHSNLQPNQRDMASSTSKTKEKSEGSFKELVLAPRFWDNKAKNLPSDAPWKRWRKTDGKRWVSQAGVWEYQYLATRTYVRILRKTRHSFRHMKRDSPKKLYMKCFNLKKTWLGRTLTPCWWQSTHVDSTKKSSQTRIYLQTSSAEYLHTANGKHMKSKKWRQQKIQFSIYIYIYTSNDAPNCSKNLLRTFE